MSDFTGGGGPEQEAAPVGPIMSLLQMVQGGSALGSAPYGGQTLAQILEGGAPLGDYPNWGDQPATHEQVSAGITRGGRYRPEVAKKLQSSDPEGGWFSIPGTQSESNVPWGMHHSGADPAPGLFGMSTNNWRLLPRGYQSPGYAMRAGNIIDRYWADKALGYAEYHGGAATAPFLLGGPGHGYPTSIGSSNQRGYFFPGQIGPWANEGGPGTT